MTTPGTKVTIDRDVYTMALERMNILYDRYDKVAVSFSGGKDSTAVLNVALKVATDRGRLPLDVAFWDEEAVNPETIEYVERVRARDDIRMKWLCVPIKHRNACSTQEPLWFPWDPSKRELWCREPPEGAIFTLPGFEPGIMGHDSATHLIYGPEHGQVVMTLGIRAKESFRRMQAMTAKVHENWLQPAGMNAPDMPAGAPRKRRASIYRGLHYSQAMPIYDWEIGDVWTAPHKLGWDYNTTYDLYYKMGLTFSQMRLSNPFGDEPLNCLHMWAQLWPDLWHKMLRRVPGVGTAWRYARTELYGYGGLGKPDNVTWEQYTFQMLEGYEPKARKLIARGMARAIHGHQDVTRRPIPEEEPDPLTGVSWKFLAMLAFRGDIKGRRIQMVRLKSKLSKDYLRDAKKNPDAARANFLQRIEELSDAGRPGQPRKEGQRY